jgi:hypothetical protein
MVIRHVRLQFADANDTIFRLKVDAETYLAAAASVVIAEGEGNLATTKVTFRVASEEELDELIKRIEDPNVAELYVLYYACTNRRVIQAIKKQHERGTKICFVFDRVWTLSCALAVACIKELLEAGVTVKHRPCSMHYKMIVIFYKDHTIFCSSGSANMSKRAWELNNEHVVNVEGDGGRFRLLLFTISTSK